MWFKYVCWIQHDDSLLGRSFKSQKWMTWPGQWLAVGTKFDILKSLFSLAYFLLCWGFRDQQPFGPFTCSQLHAHAGAARGGGWFDRSVQHEGMLSCGIRGFYHVSSMCPAPTYICLKSGERLPKGQNKSKQYQDRCRFHASWWSKDVLFTRPPIHSCLWRWSLLCLHQRRNSPRQCSHHNSILSRRRSQFWDEGIE